MQRPVCNETTVAVTSFADTTVLRLDSGPKNSDLKNRKLKVLHTKLPDGFWLPKTAEKTVHDCGIGHAAMNTETKHVQTSMRRHMYA